MSLLSRQYSLTVISYGALVITVVVHEDLSHLPVVEVVQVPDGVLRAGDQIKEDVGGLHAGHELVLEKGRVFNVLLRIQQFSLTCVSLSDVGLSLGFFCRQASTKCLKTSLQSGEPSEGLSFCAMW